MKTRDFSIKRPDKPVDPIGREVIIRAACGDHANLGAAIDRLSGDYGPTDPLAIRNEITDALSSAWSAIGYLLAALEAELEQER